MMASAGRIARGICLPRSSYTFATRSLIACRIGTPVSISVSSTANYKINTTNSDHYQFGNRIMLNSIGYYRMKIAGLDVSPNLGLLYQTAGVNHLNKEVVDQTGGWSFFGSAGLEVAIKRISVGASIFEPLAQDYAEGQTQAKLRGLLHVSFSL
jgi:hypothetical protein